MVVKVTAQRSYAGTLDGGKSPYIQLALSVLIATTSPQLVSLLLYEVQELRQQRNGSVCWYAAIYKELTEEWGKA